MVAKKKNVAENLAHSSFISDVSLYEKSVGSSLPVIDRAKVPPTLYDERLAQWLSSVNPESVSKVIDENGEPITDNIGAFSQSNNIHYSIRSGDLSEYVSDQIDRRKAPPSERVEHKEKQG